MLVILAILAAILIPSMVGWIKDAQAKACLSQLGGVRRSYLAGAALESYKVTSPQSILDYAVKEWGGEGATSATTFRCPCGSTGFVTYSEDNASILTITCNKHGTLGADGAFSTFADGVVAIWNTAYTNPDNDTVNKSIAGYFQGKADKSSLDSTGINFAPAINTQLAALGLDTDGASWRIYKNSNSQYTLT